jgi:hypothetical protein
VEKRLVINLNDRASSTSQTKASVYRYLHHVPPVDRSSFNHENGCQISLHSSLSYSQTFLQVFILVGTVAEIPGSLCLFI